MKISARIFLGYFLLVGIGVVYLLNTFMSEFRPGIRQSTEEALVDMANLLAVVVEKPFVEQTLKSSNFTDSVDKFLGREFDAKIWGLRKTNPSLRIYITDKKGIVIYDSSGVDLGADYSQWRDVYLTLRGQYGARSTKTNPNDERSTVMHVAAPIKYQQDIIGVLTVAKPNTSIQPFIEVGQQKMLRTSLILFAVSLFMGLFFAVWFTGSIRKLVAYAQQASRGERVSLPKLSEKELSDLGLAIEKMRQELEGKNYVENYIHTLTHEMKSPLSAIKGAAELMQEDMEPKQREKFLQNILTETHRLQDFINRMLDLAAVEKQQHLQDPRQVNLKQILDEIKQSKLAELHSRDITMQYDIADTISIYGEVFLLKQALNNLLDNALKFSPNNAVISIRAEQLTGSVKIMIIDQGPGIPDYAKERIFDRFYSLPQPGSDKKSSGLGLNFVQEVAALHNGDIYLENLPQQGLQAVLTIAARQEHQKHI